MRAFPIVLRPARESEYERLSEISFCAKRQWEYPEAYFSIWKEELTITPAYIRKNRVFVAEAEGQAVGYLSLAEVKESFYAGKVFVRQEVWLEHIFIYPPYLYQGIGRRLVAHAARYCREKGIHHLFLFSDPHANGFYDKIGAVYLGESLSSIEGRTVSLYRYDIPPRPDPTY